MPVNVIAGCIAATRAPTARAGSRTASPCRPEVCTTCWPSWSAPLSASIRDDVARACRRDGEQQQVAVPRRPRSACAAATPAAARRSGGARRRTRPRRPRPRDRRRGARRSGRRRRDPRRRHPRACGTSEPLSFQSLRPSAPGWERTGVGTGLLASCSTTTVRGSFPPGHRLRRDEGDIAQGFTGRGLYWAESVRASACWAGESGASSGSPTSSGRGARGSHSWVTWSTMCTPAGAVISCTPGSTVPSSSAL